MTTTTIPADYWTILDHEAWDEAVLLHGDTSQASEDAAVAALMEETREYRDFDMWPDDEGWLETCIFEGWTIRPASYRAR